MNSVRSDNLSLKYQSFTQPVYKDIGIRKSELSHTRVHTIKGRGAKSSQSRSVNVALRPFL